MNVTVYDVLAHTPPWVFILFVYLVAIGVLRLKPAIRALGKIAITPAIFIAWGLAGLFSHRNDFYAALGPWAVGALLAGALGMARRITLIVDRPRQLVKLPGSVYPLLRILVIFGAHYALQVAAALHPDSRSQWLTWDIYVSGAGAGYFIGWSIRFLQAYNQAPQADLAPVIALKA